MGEIVEDLLLALKDKKQSHKNDPFLCFCTWDYIVTSWKINRAFKVHVMMRVQKKAFVIIGKDTDSDLVSTVNL